MATTTKPYGDVTYADPGYQKDGKKRYPIDSAEHVKAAWSYVNQSDNASQYSADHLAKIKGRIKAAAGKFGIEISERSAADEQQDHVRAVPFEVVQHSDGRTLEGYAAVFDSPTHVRDWAGEYDESFARNAFDRTLREKTPKLMFEHGLHPLIGKMPLGVFQQLQPDSKGLYIRARLSDNWLIQPVRDAIADGAVDGMSVNFNPYKGGDKWSQRTGGLSRTVTEAKLKELGPVVFPAYEPTTASVRSILDTMPVIGEGQEPSRRIWAMRQGADDDPGTLAQAVDQSLDDAVAKHAAGQDDEAWQLITSAQASVDSLLEVLNVPDSDADETKSTKDERTHKRTGRSDAESADGGDHSDERPGNGRPSPQQQSAMQARHRDLQLRGIIK